MTDKSKGEKVRMNLQVSPEISDLLEKIADETGSNRSEVIRRALALMKVAHEARQRGKRLGLVSDPDKLETEIVGVL
jgi:predicted transcriptional regulator